MGSRYMRSFGVRESSPRCDHEVLEVCRKAVAGAGDGRVSKAGRGG